MRNRGGLQRALDRGGEYTFEAMILARYQMSTQPYFADREAAEYSDLRYSERLPCANEEPKPLEFWPPLLNLFPKEEPAPEPCPKRDLYQNPELAPPF
jgi:hypothetical protein